MSTLINTTKIVLLVLCAAGGYATWYLLMNNGTALYMQQLGDARLLPGTKEALKTVYTGIPALDHQLAVLCVFFWEIVDGSNPSASLHGFQFATQAFCAWGLLMIEGMRTSHRWKIISFIGMWGVLIQNCTFAVVTPIYLAIHLSTSPSVSSRRASNLNVDIADLAVLPISLALGYLLPLILMTLPAPSIIGFDQKQTFISIWQNFPVWVSLAQMILAWAIPVSGTPATPKVMSPLRALYVGLIVVAGAGQVTTLTLLAASKFLPGLFAPEYVGSFSLGKVFVPAAITPTTKMPSLVSGSLLTLQFDQLIGSTSMALWSTALLVDAYRNGKSGYSIASLVAGAAAVMALTGPLGYVTACIWARDELIFAEATGDGKKDQ